MVHGTSRFVASRDARVHFHAEVTNLYRQIIVANMPLVPEVNSLPSCKKIVQYRRRRCNEFEHRTLRIQNLLGNSAFDVRMTAINIGLWFHI
jgi:hypothetical protein